MTADLFRGIGVALLGPFPPRPGGVSVQCRTLADALRNAGAIVTEINTDLPGLRKRGSVGRLLLPFAQPAALAARLLRSRSRWTTLHVHAASWWGFMPAVVGLLARRRGKRLVLTYHGGEVARFLDRWGWLVRSVLARYDALLALTPTQARIFAQHGLSTQVVPNLVPIAEYPFRPRGPLSPRLLWVRQLEARYRPEDALAVFARVRAAHPDATLTLAGGGSLRAKIAQGVERERLVGVTLAGHLDPAALSTAYAAADLFLNTSAIDNLPLTLIEASASGLPIVSTNAGAIPDLIEHNVNGLLAPVGDVDALARAVLDLLADADLARRLSLAERANAERFAWSNLAPLLAQAYDLNAPDHAHPI